MFLLVHHKDKPSYQGKVYPVMVNLDHVEMISSLDGHACIWFKDDSGEDRSLLCQESFDEVRGILAGGSEMDEMGRKVQRGGKA